MPFTTHDTIVEREPFPGYRGRFAHGEHMTLVHWTILAGASFPEHRHQHEQIMLLIDGTFELTLEGEVRVLHAGEGAVIPSNALHGGAARTDCRVVDAFHPVRDEYR